MSAFLMLSLVILGLAGLTMVVQAAQAPSVRVDRPARAISPSVGAPPAVQPAASSAVQPAAPSADEQPADFLVAGPAAPPEPAPNSAPASASVQTTEAAGAADASLSVGTAARVVNTDGLGVILYAAPRSGARTPRGLLEGARVTVVEASGTDWARVRAPNGLDGWVPAQYVAADR